MFHFNIYFASVPFTDLRRSGPRVSGESVLTVLFPERHHAGHKKIIIVIFRASFISLIIIYQPIYFAWYLDGPAVVSVNIFVRSISKIDDVTMVSAPEQDRTRI